MDTYAIIFDQNLSMGQIDAVKARGLHTRAIRKIPNFWDEYTYCAEWYGWCNSAREAGLRITDLLKGLALPTFSIEYIPEKVV